MAEKGKRLILTVPEDIEAELACVKRELFQDTPYSDMLRQLIRMGLDAGKTQAQTGPAQIPLRQARPLVKMI